MNPPIIAVIDDDMPFLEVMSDILVVEGYIVWAYRSGPIVYQQLKNARPTLIILDVRTVASSRGWEILELLRLDPLTTTIPIIVCSADVMALRAQHDRLATLCAVPLEKPFLIEELLRKIDQALGFA